MSEFSTPKRNRKEMISTPPTVESTPDADSCSEVWKDRIEDMESMEIETKHDVAAVDKMIKHLNNLKKRHREHGSTSSSCKRQRELQLSIPGSDIVSAVASTIIQRPLEQQVQWDEAKQHLQHIGVTKQSDQRAFDVRALDAAVVLSAGGSSMFSANGPTYDFFKLGKQAAGGSTFLHNDTQLDRMHRACIALCVCPPSSTAGC